MKTTQTVLLFLMIRYIQTDIRLYSYNIQTTSLTNAGITYIFGTMFAMLASLVVCDNVTKYMHNNEDP